MSRDLVQRARHCPLCGARPDRTTFPYETTWRGHDYEYVRCSECGAAYIDPAPGPAELAQVYSRENYHDVNYPEICAEGHYRTSARLARRYAGHRTTVLDFGCGNGSFLLAARNEGFDVMGVEYEASAIDSAAHATGLPVKTLAEVLEAVARFEIIHLGDVLEHLVDPRATMRMLDGLLAPDGLYLIEGPLQSNPSLVYYTSRFVKDVKRRIGMDRRAEIAPTHVTLLNATAQLRFFESMDLERLHFRVVESGWPYLLEVPTAPSPSNALRSTIGAAAVALGHVMPGWGNRFSAVLRRRADRSWVPV